MQAEIRTRNLPIANPALYYTATSAPEEVKVKEADLYSAFIEVPYTEGAHVQITVLPANYTVPASTS